MDDLNTEPTIGPQAGPQTGPGSEPEIGPQTGPGVEPEIDPQTGPGGPGIGPQTALRTCRTLGLAAAQSAVAAAVAHAVRLDVRVNVAVVDRAGTLLAFLRMDDAFLHSVDLAIDKAYTAASFNAPTSVWPAHFAARPALVALGRRARMVPLAGGLPVRVAGELVGGIGVSGASAEEDSACAQAACHAIGADEIADGADGASG